MTGARFGERRRALIARLERGLIVVRAGDAEVSPSYRYLTGIGEGGGTLLLAAGGVRIMTGRQHPGPGYVRGRTVRQVLFLPAGDPLAARWGESGRFTSDSVRADEIGVDAVLPASGLAAVLDAALRETNALQVVRAAAPTLGGATDADADFVARVRRRFFDLEIVDATPTVDAMRRVKDACEVAGIERAAAVTAAGFDKLFGVLRAGINEYELESALTGHYRSQGATHAFEPIVGSGVNALALHYRDNDGPVEAGALVLVDTGACLDGYRCDVTRTLPVDGRFSPRQREVYEAVLRAQRATIALCRPGVLLADLHAHAWEVLDAAGLGQAFVHGTSHHLGLETHDVGDVHTPLESGCVITVEPGAYLTDEKIGVRIEDDVLITDDEPRVLTAAIPSSPEAVERRIR